MDICRRKLGISDSISGFGVPLAMVMHKPIAVLNNLCVAFFFAQYYGLECSLSWVLTAVFISSVLAISTPPIPGGGSIAYSLLMVQLGIPTEALAVALAIDMLSDFLITGCEMLVLLPAVTCVSTKIGMINEKILRKK